MAPRQKVIVVGGGPVGALAALYAARRGYETELYELRDDPNHGDPALRPDFAVIPLALSDRGMRAIEGANVPGLLDAILHDSRPTYVRMIHTRDKNGSLKEIAMPYGPQGQCLNTIQREKVTKHCLLALEKEPAAKLMFNYKMTNLDFDHKTATFESVLWKDTSYNLDQSNADGNFSLDPQPVGKPGATFQDPTIAPVDTLRFKTVKFDFLIGADGTYSTVRQHLMRKTEVDFSQVYANALWCDFILPGDENGNYRMDSKCLHIWPADENIVIAQPDFDGSFRAGMVCRTDLVRHHESHLGGFAEFFDKEFPGIVPQLLSAEEVTAQFVAHQKIPLKSVKLNKFGFRDDVVLLGDSSHTMTPFHAMGMITGLEDVRIFFQDFRDQAPTSAVENSVYGTGTAPFCPEGAVAAYSAHRVHDVNDMVDLTSEHYYELRHGVRSAFARARKACDAMLSRWAPFLGWTPLYARIQFSHERFSVVRKKEIWQRNIGNMVIAVLIAAVISGAIVGSQLLIGQQEVTSWLTKLHQMYLAGA
ncbi:kynurenine 3-monooxygenase [Xylaria castorea]|nr:kynurenine 3-monooxygenase [Xylaria castorea]